MAGGMAQVVEHLPRKTWSINVLTLTSHKSYRYMSKNLSAQLAL
jgi:hypothetical protein